MKPEQPKQETDHFVDQIVKVISWFSTAQIGDFSNDTVAECMSAAAYASQFELFGQVGHLFEHHHVLVSAQSNGIGFVRVLEALYVLQEFSSMRRWVTSVLEVLLYIVHHLDSHRLEASLQALLGLVAKALQTSLCLTSKNNEIGFTHKTDTQNLLAMVDYIGITGGRFNFAVSKKAKLGSTVIQSLDRLTCGPVAWHQGGKND